MSKYAIKNVEGAEVSQAELSDDVFGIEPNIPVIHQVVVCQDSCARQGTHSVKNRHEVSGGGVKPYRQKGTGRARQGSIRAPQWVGGGTWNTIQPKVYNKRTNNKEVKAAMRSALSAKVRDNELVLVDSYAFTQPRTKDAVAMLKALGAEGKRLTIVVNDEDINAFLSLRNIPKTLVLTPGEVTCYDLVNNGALVMTADIANHFGEVLA